MGKALKYQILVIRKDNREIIHYEGENFVTLKVNREVLRINIPKKVKYELPIELNQDEIFKFMSNLIKQN